MKLNEWDYGGHCIPTRPQVGQDTFSVGIFQWVKKTEHGQEMFKKRGPVKFRIHGHVSQPDLVLRAASAVCERLNSGKPYYWFETKSATVRNWADVQLLVNKLNGPPF